MRHRPAFSAGMTLLPLTDTWDDSSHLSCKMESNCQQSTTTTSHRKKTGTQAPEADQVTSLAPYLPCLVIIGV